MAKRYLAVIMPVCVAVSVFGVLSVRYALGRLQERNLTSSLLKRPDVAVTVIEGKRREEIAALLDAAGVTSAASFMEASSDKEGRLFPDTYRFYPSTSATEVVKTMVDNFTRRTRSINPTEDQLILASIVEREASGDAERATIAGVYANRLAIGMKLEADPTVQYGKDSDSHPRTYWGPITRADYENVLSAYNTYRIAGLPPTPIANPGLKSIVAAVQPAKHDYLYFAHRNGKLLLSKTLQEHENAIRNADQNS